MLIIVAELQAVFAVFDKDNDGFISVHEVTAVLASMGVRASPEYISDIFNQVDLDGSITCLCFCGVGLNISVHC